MIGYGARRVAGIIPLLLLVVLIVQGLMLLVPGDPAVTLSGEFATDEQIEQTRQRLDLDEPFHERYVSWVGDALQGDLGSSLYSSLTVVEAIGDRLPATLSLAVAAAAVSLVISVPAGIAAATRRGTWLDRVVSVGSSFGVAVPNFWLGLMLILVFGVWNDILPVGGFVPISENFGEWLRHIILPAVALGASATASLTRQLRSALIDVLHQDYIRTARAKGLGDVVVIGKHALKNSAVAFVTVFGIQFSFLLGGSVVVEQIFGIPGLGQLAISAVFQQDLPMVMGVVVFTALAVMLVNLAVDLSYGFFNPKVRLS